MNILSLNIDNYKNHCGHEVNDRMDHCPKCGAKLIGAENSKENIDRLLEENEELMERIESLENQIENDNNEVFQIEFGGDLQEKLEETETENALLIEKIRELESKISATNFNGKPNQSNIYFRITGGEQKEEKVGYTEDGILYWKIN
jgi:Txe/YoeB family toxin of Txe-Axe toxin-antitoxin module